MALRKHWHDLDRTTIGRVPERYGVYELGDENGDVIEVGSGVLKDELKSALAYGTGTKVRWQDAGSKEEAEALAAEHRRS